jgi:hypothetical protein
MSIGQIFDYKQFASSKTAVSILLPKRSRRDLVELIWARVSSKAGPITIARSTSLNAAGFVTQARICQRRPLVGRDRHGARDLKGA